METPAPKPLKTFAIICAICTAVSCWSTGAEARVDGYAYLDNETIGTFNVIKRAVEGPADEFDGLHWNPDLLDNMASSGDAMGPLRYVIAFSSYAVAQAATRTPAWRAPYEQVMKGLIRKMLGHKAWEDWVEQWGDNPLGPDNIMYTGHLLYMMTLYRQTFGEATFEVPVKLPNPGGPEFETDAKSLAMAIAKQAATDKDGSGEHTYSIACEPGRIYLPCNAPHRLAQVTFDRMHATSYAATNAKWLQWANEHMVHGEHGVLYDLYYPFGKGESVLGSKQPELYDRVSGVYNGWSIWMLAGLDSAWANKLYPAYKKHFVVSGVDSPKSDGRTMVLDRTGSTGLAGDALDLIATGFGMVAARQFDDQTLYNELDATWSLNFGEPKWSDDGEKFLRSFPVILALTTTEEVNLAVLAQAPWDAERFKRPFLESVGEATVFVNQAVYDAGKQALVLTINGGAATTTAVTLTVANLNPQGKYEVRRDGEPYLDWQRKGERLVITTPPLSAVEESYAVRPAEETPDEEPESSGCSLVRPGHNNSAVWLLFLLTIAALGIGRRKKSM